MRSVVAVMLALSMGGCCGSEEPEPVPTPSQPRACTKSNFDASVRQYKDALSMMNSALDNLGVSSKRTKRLARGYIRSVCVEKRTGTPPKGTDGELLCMHTRVNNAYYNAYRKQEEMLMRCAADRTAE